MLTVKILIMRKIILLIVLSVIASCAFAQGSVKIRGTVVDKETHEPLIGVTIVLQSSASVGTVTNVDGVFEMNIPNLNEKLKVSSVGYKTMVVSAVTDLRI